MGLESSPNDLFWSEGDRGGELGPAVVVLVNEAGGGDDCDSGTLAGGVTGVGGSLKFA